MKKLLFLLSFIFGLALFQVQQIQAQTLYDCFQSKNLTWQPSIVQRAEIAAQYGVWQYKGTAAQNMLLSSRMCSNSDLLGYSVITGYSSTLNLPMNSSQATIPVSSLVTKDGHTITASDFGNKVFITLEPGSVKEEIAMCTNITGSAFSNCTRGLAFYGTSTVSVAANQKTHNAGSRVIMSNSHYVYEQFLDISADKNQSIAGDRIATGTWTFQQTPLSTSTTVTDPLGLITLGQLTSVTSTGCADASETVRGCVEEATVYEAIGSVNVTSTGSTGARLFVSPDVLYPSMQQNIITARAFGTVNAGDVVYASTNQVRTALGNNQSNINQIVGYALDTGTNVNIRVALPGSVVSSTIGAVPNNSVLYLSDTGQVSGTPGTIRKVVGFYVSSTAFLFNPSIQTPTSSPGQTYTPVMTSASGTIPAQFIATSSINGQILSSTSTGSVYRTPFAPVTSSTINKTAVRSTGTTYYNSSTMPILVEIDGHTSGGTTGAGVLTFYRDTTSTNMYVIRTQTASAMATPPSLPSQYTTFIVPSGWYYKVTNDTTGNSSAAINKWHETEF